MMNAWSVHKVDTMIKKLISAKKHPISVNNGRETGKCAKVVHKDSILKMGYATRHQKSIQIV